MKVLAGMAAIVAVGAVAGTLEDIYISKPAGEALEAKRNIANTDEYKIDKSDNDKDKIYIESGDRIYVQTKGKTPQECATDQADAEQYLDSWVDNQLSGYGVQPDQQRGTVSMCAEQTEVYKVVPVTNPSNETTGITTGQLQDTTAQHHGAIDARGIRVFKDEPAVIGKNVVPISKG